MKTGIRVFLRLFLKKVKMVCLLNFSRIFFSMKLSKTVNESVIFISEKNNWAIKYVGQNISNKINEKYSGFIKFTLSPRYYQNKIIHFGSQYMWVDWWKILPKNNHYIVSFFHGKPEDGDDVKKHICDFIESVPYIATIIISSSIMQKRLNSWGVSSNKICLIPIGVNNSYFIPTNSITKNKIRIKYGIKKSSIVIGSFQKDGVGWKKGELPKLIKGPDIFIEVIKYLKEKGYPILVFLTGPARGYMKKELKKIHVPFIHEYFINQKDLLTCYHALDIYLITSREEGGPMGLMEAMASGVPVVSSPVGMSVDLIQNNISGKISNDVKYLNLSKLVIELIENKEIQKIIIKNALTVVDEVSWAKISSKHYKDVYLPLVVK